ncbi:unnamed protein product [Pedinophyceae sp. YPF-701]|nr:unnamed protein product [Pedinophyceae sp. YPF-701]
MTHDWDERGCMTPLTVLWIDECIVTGVKTKDKDGYTALQVGSGSKKPKQIHKRQRGQFVAKGIPIKRHVSEFQVTEDALLPVGTPVTAAHFRPGQFIDVQGTTIGKGFQGAMKRHGFKGQEASHGNTKAHRKLGSTGNRKTPARVFPGKKMPGRMGGVKCTQERLYVWRTDPERNLLWVRGQVPGHAGNVLRVRDSLRAQWNSKLDTPAFEKYRSTMLDLPVPTWTSEELPPGQTADQARYDYVREPKMQGRSFMWRRSRHRR